MRRCPTQDSTERARQAVAVVFAVNGLTFGSWISRAPAIRDVAMNVEGADVERRLARTLMPRFHACFSFGTVLGAGLGAGCAALGVDVTAQLLGTAVVAAAVVVTVTRAFLRVSGQTSAGAVPVRATAAWRERRTLLVGVAVLCFALGEGVANDWLAIAVVDGYGRSDAFGAATFGVFVTAMTLARATGGGLLERHGRPPVLRALALTVVAGVGLVVLGPSPAWALAGAAVWGLGASLGFPVGMSAAADDERMATARVSVVSSIGYTAFLGGPPLVGALADRFGTLDALSVVAGAMAIALATVGALAPPPPGEPGLRPRAPRRPSVRPRRAR